MNDLAPPPTRQAPVSQIGTQLYRLLPGVYRDRDNTTAGELGDFGKFLDSCGELLDRIRETLEQRLADSFPDNPPPNPDGPPFRAVQPWLLPYFAQLVDVRLVSPDPAGQRDEVGQAVAWRQRKGTLACIEEIAQSVGRIEVEVQEGWRRVATTPRIGMPLTPAPSLGVDPTQPIPGGGRELKFDPRRPIDAARHPGLPAVTIDMRFNSGALPTDVTNPAAHVTSFDGQSLPWRQVYPHGVPCALGSYQDVSARTVDVRTPNWSHGWAHPRRVLLYVPPPLGFYKDGGLTAVTPADAFTSGDTLTQAFVEGTLTVARPGLVIDGCAIERLVVTAASPDQNTPVVTIRNSLIDSIEAATRGCLVEMEYCTVLGNATFDRVHASECIFAGALAVAREDSSCLRYSRLPAGVGTNTADPPLFQDLLLPQDTAVVRRPAHFGEKAAGVLHPATSPAVRFGAEDGGEMGVYHAQAYALRMQAVLEKLADYLPVGMSAALIVDPTLLQTPGRKVSP